MKKLGIIGYGSVGQYLTDRILNDEALSSSMQLAFVWNRNADKLDDGLLPKNYWLTGDLEAGFCAFLAGHEGRPGQAVDMLVEVAHPDIVSKLGPMFLKHCDLFVSSVTALADAHTESKLRNAISVEQGQHGLYIPTGAGWGVEDIRKMDKSGSLNGLTVTMQFNADALRLNEPLKTKLASWLASEEDTGPLKLYEGNIRALAEMAPNNVNTMICLAMAGSSMGLDHTVGRLFAQKSQDAHIVEIEVLGPDGFNVKTTRYNPAKKGAVTGSQTYGSFLSSLTEAGGKGPGIHFC